MGQRLEALMQGLAVAQGFLSCRVCMVVAILGMLEEQVRGCDDTFDLRAVLGFQQWDGVHQHCLVRDQLGRLFQFGQGCARFNTEFEHCAGFKLG